MDKIKVKIVTPTSVLFDKDIYMVTMPGTLGEFGVLPGHEPLITSLKTGIIKISTELGEKESEVICYFVSSGIVEVTGTNVNIVAEYAIDLTNLHHNNVTEKIAQLKETMSKETDATKADVLKLTIERYESLLKYIN